VRARSHVRLFALAILVWGGFWLAGLPDYYQQYSYTTMAIFSLALIPAIAFAGAKVIGRARVERRRALGGWLGFYFTVPFAVLDYAYCGLYLGHGWAFLSRYWYLTVYYAIPWLVFVPIGYRLSRHAGGPGVAREREESPS
jgi:hypothetical protein